MKFKSDTKDLLEDIFNAEYEFVYWYDNKSRWEELDNYVYFGGEAVMTAVTTIARNQQVKAADLGLTNSSRLLIPQNLVSILMVTAIAI